MHIHGIDAVIVDDRAQAGAGKCNLCVRVFALDQPGVHTGRESVLAEIIQTQKGRETNTAHATHKRALLGIDAVRENPLVAGQMQGLVFVRIVSLLEYGHIVRTAFMQISVLIRIHGIDFHANYLKILAGNLAGLADVFDSRLAAALTGQNQDLLQTGLGNRSHLLIDLFRIQHSPLDFVVAVKSAVDAVILAVIGYIQRREDIYGISEMPAGLDLGFLCHLFQEWRGRR